MSLRATSLRAILAAALLLPALAAPSAAMPAGRAVAGAPTVAKVTPRAGPTAGGNTVTIAGSGFVAGATVVTFGGTPSPSVTVVTHSKLTAVAPANAPGTVDVEVTTAGGTSDVSQADLYAYGPPTVTNVAPSAGPLAGGNTVTITGTGFVPGAFIRFGGSANATSVTFVSGTELQAVVPSSGTAGAVHVRVGTAAGGSTATSADLYAYGPPVVTAVTPAAGPTSGGNSVTVSGSGFTPDAAVKFGSTASTSVTFLSSTKLSAVAPAGAAGTVDVQVSTAGGDSAAGNQDLYAYGAPTVTALSPKAGPTAGGNTVTITGSGFVPSATVRFGSTSSPSVTFVSATELTAVAPAGAPGVVQVRVATAAGASAASDADLYTYGAPAVTGVSPRAGATAGGNTVTITGSGFVPGATTVQFGANAAGSVTVVSPGKLTAVAPAGSAGTVDVLVTTDAGTSATGDKDVYAYGAPTVTGVSPDTGPTTGGNPVTISGTGFVPGAVVRFGATTATSVTFVSGGELQTVAPPAAGAGTVPVRVSTPAGASATSNADLYAYGARLSVVDTGLLLAGTVSLNAESSATPSAGAAAVDFQYSATGKEDWQPACEALGTERHYSCGWDTSSVPDGVYDVRAVSAAFGTAAARRGITVSNTVPKPSLVGVGTGQNVQGRLTLQTAPAGGRDLADISRNLVPNWSMETLDERGTPVGWRGVASHPKFLPLTPVGLKATDELKPTVAGAAQLNVKSLEPGGEAYAWSYQHQIPVIAGRAYRAAVLMALDKLDPGMYATVAVTWFDAHGKKISIEQGPPVQQTGVGGSGLTTTAPHGAAFASLSPAVFNAGSANGDARLIFTDPRFEQDTGVPPVNPNVTVQYRYPSTPVWNDLGGGCQPTATSVYTCPVTLSALAKGQVDLRIAVLDNAGHFGYSPTVTPTVTGPGVAFTQATYTAHESEGSATITVTRTDASGSEWFTYGVRALSAQPGIDLGAIAPTSVQMTPGESSYSFQVPIIDRGINGPPLQAQVYLTDSYPDQIATPSATIAIVRDDPLQKRRRSNPLGLPNGKDDPLRGAKLYVPGPGSIAGQAEQQASASGAGEARALGHLASQPLTQVFTPVRGQDTASTVAAYLEQASVSQPGTVPLLAARYFSPWRCTRRGDSQSQRAAYEQWIRSVAYGIGNFRAVLFLEPGAIPGSRCLSARAASVRAAELAAAVRTLDADPHVAVYIDGGGAGVRSASWTAGFLARAGVRRAQGFFLNADRYDWVRSELAFGQRLSSRLRGAHFVVDTSQDGRGPAHRGASCKQRGRGLGVMSTRTGYAHADAMLWIAGPGISDGSCFGAPHAGSFWPSYAASLVTHAVRALTGPRARLKRAGPGFRPYAPGTG